MQKTGNNEKRSETNSMMDESETKGVRAKLRTIQDSIRAQTDPTNKLTLRQVKLLQKNKQLGEDYVYHIQSVILPNPRPKTMPPADKLKAVIRWENTTTPINQLPTQVRREAMDLARMQWKNPELEAMEVTLAKEEWNLVNEHLEGILSEKDIKEGMRQLLKLNSNGEEIHPAVLKELLFLQKTNRVEYGINIPFSDEQLKQKD